MVGYTSTEGLSYDVRRLPEPERDVIHQARAVAPERAFPSLPAILPAPGCCIPSREL